MGALRFHTPHGVAKIQTNNNIKRTIEQVLNIRFSNDLPTVIMTNRKPTELFGSQGDPNAALFSSQLRSRFKNGYLVDFTGPDLRNQAIVEEGDYDDPF